MGVHYCIPRDVILHAWGGGAIYLPAHSLNLAVGDTIRGINELNDTLENVRMICKLIKKSPQRETKLKHLKEQTANVSKGVHSFCPTRWTVRGDACAAMINNHSELVELWDWSLEKVKEPKLRARVSAAKSTMQTHKFIFGCMLCVDILKRTDMLSKALQNGEISAAEGQSLAYAVLEDLECGRTEENFSGFWDKVADKCSELSVDDPKLPRNANVSVEEYYHRQYFETLDTITQTVRSRFDQPDYKTYQNIEELLLKAVKRIPFDTELSAVCSFYDEFDSYVLEPELKIFSNLADDDARKELNTKKLIQILQFLKPPQKFLLPNVVLLGKLLLVMPATNAISERSFSALKLVKTYLRSKTSDQLLNHEMLMYVHKQATDTMDLIKIGREFVANGDDRRKRTFGQFSLCDIVRPKKLYNASTQTDSKPNN
jgi:hypothetical protein